MLEETSLRPCFQRTEGAMRVRVCAVSGTTRSCRSTILLGSSGADLDLEVVEGLRGYHIFVISGYGGCARKCEGLYVKIVSRLCRKTWKQSGGMVCIVTKSGYTENEDFAKADTVFPTLATLPLRILIFLSPAVCCWSRSSLEAHAPVFTLVE